MLFPSETVRLWMCCTACQRVNPCYSKKNIEIQVKAGTRFIVPLKRSNKATEPKLVSTPQEL